VSLKKESRSDHAHKHGAADGTCVARMPSVNVLERMNELRDGVIRPFNATREGRRGSISEIPVDISGVWGAESQARLTRPSKPPGGKAVMPLDRVRGPTPSPAIAVIGGGVRVFVDLLTRGAATVS